MSATHAEAIGTGSVMVDYNKKTTVKLASTDHGCLRTLIT